MAKTTPSSDFSTQRSILNFKPNIHYVEPDQIDDTVPPTPETTSIDQIKSDVSDLLSNYQDISDTADDLQSQIYDRAKGVIVKLDPSQDQHIIQAVQRHFADPNKTQITYDDYLACVKDINNAGPASPAVNQSDIDSAATDQYRSNFGALGMPSGLARPELSGDAQTIKPIDLNQFQIEQLEKLLTLLTPGVNQLILNQIKKKTGL